MRIGATPSLVLVLWLACELPVAHSAVPPRAGGRLAIAFADSVESPDPQAAWSFGDWMLIRQVHAGLYRPSGSGVVADLAVELPRRVGDGRYRVQIRDDATFHSGLVVTSDDVLRMWKRAGVRRIRAVAVDTRTVEFIGARALTADMLALHLAAIIRVVAAKSPYVGAGPFVFHASAEHIRLSAYLRHHLGRPWVDEVVIQHGLGVEGVEDAFRYRRADLVFRDVAKVTRARRVKGPIRETVGLIVFPHISVDSRRHVRRNAPRSRLAEVVAGAATVARSSTPFRSTGRHRTEPAASHVSVVQWRLVTTETLEPVVHNFTATFSSPNAPWKSDVVSRDRLTRSLAAPAQRRWSAALVPWYHAAIDGAAATELLERTTEQDLWIPLVHRGRTATVRATLSGVEWDTAGLVDLASLWRR